MAKRQKTDGLPQLHEVLRRGTPPKDMILVPEAARLLKATPVFVYLQIRKRVLKAWTFTPPGSKRELAVVSRAELEPIAKELAATRKRTYGAARPGRGPRLLLDLGVPENAGATTTAAPAAKASNGHLDSMEVLRRVKALLQEADVPGEVTILGMPGATHAVIRPAANEIVVK